LQKIEFSSLEQGQSETIPGRHDVARAPASQSARARRTPPRCLGPLAPSRGSFPEATHAPRPPRSPPSSSRRAAGQALDGPSVPSGRSARPCCPRPPSTTRGRSSLLHSAQQGAPNHYKGGATRRAPHAPPSTAWATASAIRGCRGELRVPAGRKHNRALLHLPSHLQ
jgi:hypothetical protein